MGSGRAEQLDAALKTPEEWADWVRAEEGRSMEDGFRMAMAGAFTFGKQMSAAAIRLIGTDTTKDRLSKIIEDISLPNTYRPMETHSCLHPHRKNTGQHRCEDCPEGGK